MNSRLGITVLLALWAYVACSDKFQFVESKEVADLYSAIDDVIRLNSTTFVPTVFHQNKNITYMVQFYNTFCGHCQMFAPVYKELGSRVKNWTSVVRLAGVDCSKEENVITCSENKIDGYPTILIFPPNARPKNPKDKPLNLRSLNIEWTVDDIEESIVDYIGNLSSTNHEHSLVVEAMQPVTINDVEDLTRIYPSHEDSNDGPHSLQDLMIIVESEKSYLGRKLIIEYFRIHPKLELRRVLTSNRKFINSMLSGKELAKLEDSLPILVRLGDHKSVDFDKVLVLVRGEISQILPTSTESERNDHIHDKFKLFFEHFYSIELKEYDALHPKPNAIKKEPKSPDTDNVVGHNGELEIQHLIDSDLIRGKKIFAMDLLKSITYMLTHEVQIKGDLTPTEFNTVRNLLTILKKYLPLEKWDTKVNKFIVELRTRLDANRGVYEQNGITAQEMRDHMDLSGSDAVRLRYSRENWVSCFNSDKQHKGYTCSLWLLFHALTAGEYSKAPPARFRPTMVLFTMRDYITKFLGCTVCASNFAKETESLNSSLNSRNSSVIWLWYTHNLVNQRLNNERQDNKKPLGEVIFPLYEHCSECYLDESDDVGLDGETFEDIKWNLTIVFDTMIDIYRPDRIITPTDMSTLLAKIRGKLSYDLISESSTNDEHLVARRFSTVGADMNQSEKWNIHSIFSTGDISLCLFLYLACIMIVAIVCVALNPRWTRFKAKL